MSVTLVGTGGIFKRLGVMFGVVANSVALQGGSPTTDVASGASATAHAVLIESHAAESPAVSEQIDGHWSAINSWRSSQSSLLSGMRTLAEKVFIRQVDLDASLPEKTLLAALQELQRQMRANSTSINQSTVSAGSQTAVGSPTGVVKIVSSVKNADGYTLQTPFAETIRFKVTSDSQSGSGTARNESISIRGAAAVSDVGSWQWPGGSGANKTINVVDAQSDNSKGNLLQNSDFETFGASNYPSNWVIATGTAGTTVFAAGAGYTGDNALKITGDAGGTLTAIRQTFDTTASTTAGSGGTAAELEPNTQYAIGLWVKRDNAQSAGVLRVALVDGSHAITTDVAGTANSFTIDCTALTASYVFYSGTFRTPLLIPSNGFKLQLGLTTAIDSGDSIFLDDIAMTKMTALYNGGPSFAAFAGATNPIINDQWTIAISCTMGTMAMWLERFFSLRDKGVQLPYSGSPTAADSLVS